VTPRPISHNNAGGTAILAVFHGLEAHATFKGPAIAASPPSGQGFAVEKGYPLGL